MTKLIDRIAWAKENLEPVQPSYCITWEDPDDIDAPVQVTTPSPEWLACAMHGDILPPVEVYHAIEDAISDGRVTNGHLLHEKQIGPMTEDEAMEYLLMKDVPRRVWQDQSSNRPRFNIVPRTSIPTNRAYRNAWRLSA